MPAYRSKMCCASRVDPIIPKPRKPSQPRKSLTPEERAVAKVEAEKKKAKREANKEWAATLKPWAPNSAFRFAVGTMAMYKSDAKSAYSLTDKEMLTLSHESIPRSSKTFYSQEQVKALARKKFEAGAAKEGLGCEEVKGNLRLFKKVDNDNRRRRANFQAQFPGYVDPSEYRY